MSITLTPKILDALTRRIVELTNKKELSEVHLAAFIELIDREPSNEELELFEKYFDKHIRAKELSMINKYHLDEI